MRDAPLSFGQALNGPRRWATSLLVANLCPSDRRSMVPGGGQSACWLRRQALRGLWQCSQTTISSPAPQKRPAEGVRARPAWLMAVRPLRAQRQGALKGWRSRPKGRRPPPHRGGGGPCGNMGRGRRARRLLLDGGAGGGVVCVGESCWRRRKQRVIPDTSPRRRAVEPVAGCVSTARAGERDASSTGGVIGYETKAPGTIGSL
jgi:hypothetical protein